MNYCIHLKKRKNKPFCKLLDREITLSECNSINSENKCREYKTKKEDNLAYKKKRCTKFTEYSAKGTVKSTVRYCKSAKMKNKSNKRITVLKEVYNIVIERDKYCCRLCGSTNLIQLHHILYRSQRKDLINDINNCIMLCDNCHRLVHNNKKKWQPILLEMNKNV